MGANMGNWDWDWTEPDWIAAGKRLARPRWSEMDMGWWGGGDYLRIPDAGLYVVLLAQSS